MMARKTRWLLLFMLFSLAGHAQKLYIEYKNNMGHTYYYDGYARHNRYKKDFCGKDESSYEKISYEDIKRAVKLVCKTNPYATDDSRYEICDYTYNTIKVDGCLFPPKEHLEIFMSDFDREGYRFISANIYDVYKDEYLSLNMRIYLTDESFETEKFDMYLSYSNSKNKYGDATVLNKRISKHDLVGSNIKVSVARYIPRIYEKIEVVQFDLEGVDALKKKQTIVVKGSSLSSSKIAREMLLNMRNEDVYVVKNVMFKVTDLTNGLSSIRTFDGEWEIKI